jgi:hypothetical protein
MHHRLSDARIRDQWIAPTKTSRRSWGRQGDGRIALLNPVTPPQRQSTCARWNDDRMWERSIDRESACRLSAPVYPEIAHDEQHRAF